MRTRSIRIDGGLAGKTVESILSHEFGMSGGMISRLKRRPSGILLDGARVYTTARVAEGAVLTAETGDAPGMRVPPPMPYPLSVAYEDEDLLVIDKPAGLAVHPTHDPEELTVENALAAYLTGGANAHPVSRLDRGTSGLMTVAQSGYMHELLRRMLHTPGFSREYRGVAIGTVRPVRGVIELPIGFAPGSSYQRAVQEGGAPSRTVYETLACGDGLTLLRLVPETGRTHQLRVHMAAIGFPLAGDWLYGQTDGRIARPALHSSELWLTHPLTGERLHLISPLPADMARLTDGMRSGAPEILR